MTGLYPNDDVAEHVLSVAMELLASGRATATEVADLSGISLKRVKRWISRTVASNVSTETIFLDAIPSVHSRSTSKLGEVTKGNLTAQVAGKSELSAGLHLWELKARKPTNTPWPGYVRETFDLGQSRAGLEIDRRLCNVVMLARA